jgi:hypothetical protein
VAFAVVKKIARAFVSLLHPFVLFLSLIAVLGLLLSLVLRRLLSLWWCQALMPAACFAVVFCWWGLCCSGRLLL